MLESLRNRIEKSEPFYEKNAIKNIFSWKEFENLLNLRPFNNKNRFKVFLDKDEKYEWHNKEWLTDINSYPPSVIKQMFKKHLCHMVDSSRVNEKINTICSELDEINKLSTDAHIYFDLTDNQNVGFGIHFDYAHNLIVQIEGKSRAKMWDVKESDEQKRSLKQIDEKPLFDIVMEPGDIIYAPAHYYHEVKSLTKRLSISFPSSVEIHGPQEREWIHIC